MFVSVTKAIGIASLAAALGAGLPANAAAQGKDSGFLKDYSQLKTEKDPLGVERRIRASPKLTREAYQKALIERVTFYLASQPNEKVSGSALEDIRSYGDAAIRKAMASVVPLADAPGSGVLRVRIALTAATVEGAQLKPYQLIPVALVLTAATEAAGEGRRDVKLAVETEISDSVSGEPLARAVREAQGVRVKSDEKLTLEVAKPQIDKWAESARESLAARLKPSGR